MHESVPQREPHLRPIVYVLGTLLLLGACVLLWQAPMLLLGLLPSVSWPTSGAEEAPPPLTLQLDERFTTKPGAYGAAPPVGKEKPPPPVAKPLPPLPVLAVAATPLAPAPPPAPEVKPQVDPLPGFLEREAQRDALLNTKLAELARQQQQAQPPPRPATAAEKEKPKNPEWFIKPTNMNLNERKAPERGKEEEKRQEVVTNLIQPARWARPIQPWNTLYLGQVLPGRTLEAINSDTPGLTNIEFTVPIFDANGYGHEILPKGAIATVRQEGKPDFGQSRLPMKLVQMRIPGKYGTVIDFKGGVGDDQGAAGLAGPTVKTDNHYGKLLAAAGINVLLNLGVGYAAGTPGRGYYYQDPAQKAANDATQQAAQEIKSLTQAQLKVPPTITAPMGAIVTIVLEENVQMNRKPYVAR